MYISKQEIFKKTWLWSVICGIVVATVSWLIMDISIFHWIYKLANFVDILILLSIAGSYFGAGYVGWRIAEKYYNDREKYFVKRYLRYSIASFMLLIAITYSPLSFLGLLWSLVAPLCVLQALKYVRQRHS